MKFQKLVKPVVDYYKDVRFYNLKSKKYNHLFLVLYWPLFGLIFLTLERLLPMAFDITYHPVVCKLDAYIPFDESFVIPYYYWFVFLIGFGAYWILYEPRAFRDWMWAIILTYSSTVVIYLIYPTMQELRPAPEELTRNNLFMTVVRNLYDFDTNTNVCPSIHVLGSLSVMFAGLHSKTLRGVWWKLFFILSTLWISASTVFLKQHSFVDVVAAYAVGLVCYAVQFWLYPVLEKGWLKKHPAEWEDPAPAAPVAPCPEAEIPAAEPDAEEGER